MLKTISLKKIFSPPNPRHENFFTRLVYDYQNNTFFQDIKANRVLEEYLVGGVVKVRIVEGEDGLYYVIEEPGLASGEAEFLGRILGMGVECESLECLSSMLNGDGGSNGLAGKIYYHYMKITTGYGPLYPILLDPLVEEISLNSSDKRVWIIHRAFNQLGWMKTNMMVGENLVDRLVLSFSRKIRKHVSIASPIAEGLTREGYRVSLVFGSDVSRKGSSIVVRKKPEKPWTITQLINSGVLNSVITAYLWLILDLKGWIIIAGGVGAGKTTLLQGLLNLVPFNKRVVTIEDTPELYLPSEQWDPLVEHLLPIDSGQSIDMYHLLRVSLRRRPDYIVVGEVRGVEARLLVQASRLGHGVLNTIHGDSPDSVLKRLTAYPISIPRNLLGNIWSIIVVEQTSYGRKVIRVSEVTEEVDLVDVALFENGVFKPVEIGELASRSARLTSKLGVRTVERELAERSIFLERLVARGVFDEKDLMREINGFYRARVLPAGS